MVALFGLLTIIILSITIVRIGALALELTGLSEEIASFQSQSAFSGVGFTTSESETIVTHPVRRRIIRVLILLGSAGFTSTVATFILTFVGQTGKDAFLRGIILVLGIVFIFIFSRSKIVWKALRKVITAALEKYTSLKVCDYQEVLGLKEGYSVSRVFVDHDSWMVGKSLEQLQLNQEGILVLSVHRIIDREDKFIGMPAKDTIIDVDDILYCYGRSDALRNLARRERGYRGDKEHETEIKKEQIIEEIQEEN